MKRAGPSGHRYRRPARLLSGLVAVLAVLWVVAACGGSGSGGGATPSASPTGSGTAGDGSTVEIKDFMFTPASLTVPVGTTVTWKFEDSSQHTVTADDNSFTSAAQANGETFTHTFGTAGTVAYHCSIHSFMTATIIVK